MMKDHFFLGFEEELEKTAFLNLLYEAPLLWIAEAINAKSLLQKGEAFELGETSKGIRGKIIDLLAKATHPKSKTPLSDFAALPSSKDLLKPHRWPERVLSPLTAPYAAGRQKGKILKETKSLLPKPMFDAFRGSMSLDSKKMAKGEEYFKKLTSDVTKELKIDSKKGSAVMKSIIEQISSTDPKTRAQGLKKVKRLKTGIKSGIGFGLPLALIGAGYLGKELYDKLSNNNELEKVSFEMKHRITNIAEMRVALKKAMEQGIDKGLKKRFGLKGGLITGGSVATGLVLGNYLSNLLTRGVEETIGKPLSKTKRRRVTDVRTLD